MMSYYDLKFLHQENFSSPTRKNMEPVRRQLVSQFFILKMRLSVFQIKQQENQLILVPIPSNILMRLFLGKYDTLVSTKVDSVRHFHFIGTLRAAPKLLS